MMSLRSQEFRSNGKDGRLSNERRIVQAPQGPSHNDPKLEVVMATETGGWNTTTNRLMAAHLARDPRLHVRAFVPQNTKERHELASVVELLEDARFPGFSAIELLEYPSDKLKQVDFLIMHSYSHRQVEQADELCKAMKCKLIHVDHDDWGEFLNFFHGYSKNVCRAEQQRQLELCKKADLVVTVGPKIAQSFRNALQTQGKNIDIISITPGIHLELGGVSKNHKGRTTFNVLVVIEYSNLPSFFEVKGCDIAMNAILLLNDTSYHIIFAMNSVHEARELEQILLQRGLQSTQFSIKSIADDAPESFARFINEVDVFILPSRVEGFGMGGLYAISANLPVLVSGSAGLGVALQLLPSGSKHVVHSNDSQVWADKIKDIRAKGHGASLEAEQLRKEYLDKFSWENQCNDLVEKMIIKDEILARGPLAVKAYNKALEQGKTRVMRLPIMLIGQERSGKTSLKKSLQGQQFNEKEESTDVIEIDPSYFSVSTEIWSTGEANKEPDAESALALASRVAKLMVTDLMGTGKHAVFSSESANPPGAGSSSDTNSAESKETEANSEPHSSPKEFEQTDESFEKEESGAGNLFTGGERKQLENIKTMQNVPDATAACVEKLLQEFEKKEVENIYSVLWDFGGQSVYYATHPLFLTPKAIYLLVYDLTKNPHEKASAIVKQGTFKQKEDRYCRKTNEDYLHFWLSSISSLARKDSESFATGKLPKRLPPVILVCTHADKCARAKELAREIYGSLLCGTKPNSEHLSKTYFVVDNTKSGSDDECPEVQRLRNEVRQVAKQLPQLKESIPIKWLRYEEALRLKKDSGEPFISRDEARRVASDDCGIDDDQQFNTLLNFLHDQRIVIHFDDTSELEKMVVLDPQWLIDLFRKVITVKPYDPTTDEEQFEKLWQKLENESILDDKLLQTVWRPLLNKEAADSLVAVMEKFSLLCSWPSAGPRKQYLVPSMLMCSPDEADLLVTDLIPPLFLRFTQMHSAPGVGQTAAQQYIQVPLGLFPRLVIKFFQWCVKEELGPLFRAIYQNLARFPIRPKGYSAVLLCHSSSIEIMIHRDLKSTENTSKVAIGCTVRSVLESILQRIREEFFWLRSMEHEFSVLCPVCCNQRSVSYCREHHTSGCEREECLHYWSESELQMHGEPVCMKNTLAGRTVVSVEDFAPWFGFSAKQQQFDSELLCSFGDSLVKDAIVAKVRVMDELACRLDQPTYHGKRELPLTQYWVHLAEEFQVPEEVVIRCQHNSENSPTRSMLEFLEGRDPHFKVQCLKNELCEIYRNDLVEKLEKCSLQDTATIRNLREDNPETLESICLHMDHSKKWLALGRRLGIPNETLLRIATSSSCTETVLDLIGKRNPQLTVEDIEATLTEMQRKDVCVVLKKHLPESGTISDLRDNLDCLDEVAALLDKETPGVKNWLHFARKFGVSKDDCDHMKPKGNPSPTKMVMEYLVQVNPQLTLKQFIETLMKMERKDVVYALKKFF